MQEIITHSDSRLVFVNESLWNKLNKEHIKVPVFEIPPFSLLKSQEVSEIINSLDDLFTRNYPKGFSKDDIRYADVSNEEVICINYTSGTTGFSQGVMLTANNLAGNVTYAHKLDLLFNGERNLAFLPMAMSTDAPLIFSLRTLCWGSQHPTWSDTRPELR